MDELTANQLQVLLFAYSNTVGGLINGNTYINDINTLKSRGLLKVAMIVSDEMLITVSDLGHELLNRVLSATRQLNF